MPQGSILGPLLFILFLNDLPDQLVHSKSIIYADDTVIYVAGTDPIVIQNKLIEDMTKLSKYFNENGLLINLKKGKTEAMLMGTSKRLNKVPEDLKVLHCEQQSIVLISITT